MDTNTAGYHGKKRRLQVEPLEPRRLLAAVPVISEFMADNDDSLLDGDGQSSDWIEIHNAGDEMIDLAGWHLTDDAADLTQWTFPSVQLDAGDHLVVFASGQAVEDYVDPAGNLHTNFQLDRRGEYLALVEPDGVAVATQFAADGADYPEQFEDVSYGAGTQVTVASLLTAGAAAQALVPTDDSLGTAWTLPEFVPDGSWVTGTTGVGFADVIPDLGFWLKAEQLAGLESGDPVAVWPDVSGQGNDAVQTEPIRQPIWIDDAVGGQAAVRFDGDDDVLNTETLFIGSETTVLLVTRNAQQTTTGSIHRGVLTADDNPYRTDGDGYGFGYQRGNVSGFGVSLPQGAGGTSEQRIASTVPADDRFEIISYRKSAAQAELFRNGTLVSTGTQNDPAGGYHTGYNIGADPSYASREYRGDVAEILVFNRALDEEQYASVLDYLMQQYDLADPPEPPRTEADLVSYWDFNDGVSVTDQAGSNDAISNVGVTFSADAPAAGGAGSLDLGNADNYVVLPASTYGVTDAYSIAAWVKPANTSGGRILSIKRDLTSGGGDRSGVTFGLGGGNKLFSGVITPPGAGNDDYNDIAAANLGAPAGQWSHIAVTFQDDRVTMYLNGNPELVYANGTGPTTGMLKLTGKGLDFDDANGSFSGIGADGRGGNLPADLAGFFDGLVDELAVWTGTLHPTQVALLAAGAYTPATLPDVATEPPRNGLTSYWTFDANTPADDFGANDGIGQVGAAFSTDAPNAGGAASLDLTGRANYITLPPVTYGIADEYTISAWVKPADTSGGRFFSIRRDLTAGGVDRAGVNFGLAGGNTLYTGLITPPGPGNADFNDITSTSLAAPAGQWSHVAVTLEDGFVTMYLDGVAETVYSSTLGPDTGQLKTTGTNVDFHDRDGSFSGFGADGRGGNVPADLSGYFSGLIDEVAVWNVAQDAANIALLADGTFTPATLPLPEPTVDDPGLDGAAFVDSIGLDLLDAMLGVDRAGVNASALIRVPFDVADPNEFDSLALRIQYDDGFIAYLNGTEIARRNAPASLPWNATATRERPVGEAVWSEQIDVSEYLDRLVPGPNVLAVHGLNAAANDREFFILPELVDVDVSELGSRYFSPPTPGTVNGAGIDNSGPAISDVSRWPLVPSGTDELVVTARVVPKIGAEPAEVQLVYRVMYGAEAAVPMLDDGAGADAVLGDGIFTAAIPAGTASAGQMVRWFVSAADANGNPSRKPEFFRPGQSAQYFGTVIADATVPETPLPVIEWFVEDPDWHKVPAGGNNRDYAFASVFYDGVFYDNMRVRVRGGVTQNQPKPNLKFDFYNGGHFQYDPEQPKVEEFNLQSLQGEIPTRTYMRDPLAYQIFREAGTAAPNSFYVQMRQNGQFYSLAAWTEQVDAIFLERNGLDGDGALYKAKSGAMLQTNPTSAQWRKGTRKDEDYSDLAELTAGLSLADPVAREQFLFDNVDVAQVIHYLAVTLLGPNHDRLTHNYYMYRDTNGSGLWSVIPWDLDRWFPQGGLLTSPVTRTIFYGDSDHPRISGTADTYNRLNDAIFDVPRSREMFLAHLRNIVDQYMGTEPGYLEESVDAIASRIEADAALDNAKWSLGSLEAGIAAMKNSIATRRSQLAGDPDIPPAVPANSPIAFGQVEFNPASGDQDQEFIELANPNGFAVDISTWRLVGGVQFVFPPGTVVPAGESLFVTPSVAAFRARQQSPTGGEGRFVQGGYSGHISNLGELIELRSADDTLIASITTTFAPSPVQRYLRVSEVMYNPPEPTPDEIGAGFVDNDDFEFVELVNTSDTETLTLDGVAFTRGIGFTFPDDGPATDETTLAPDERILVVRNLAAFGQRYDTGTMTIAGEYRDPVTGGNRLSNDGETLKLEDADNSTIQEFAYNDSVNQGWPASPDGEGHSLEAVSFDDGDADPATWNDYGDSAFWYAAPQWGGSPGAAATAAVIERLVFYDGSAFDTVDDDAVAADKRALLPGQTATASNYTNYTGGINGLIIDVAWPGDRAALGGGDFTLLAGNDGAPSSWTPAAAPVVTVRPGEGRGGSDRVVFTWPIDAPTNTWLQVTTRSDMPNTGLPADDVFYFGNAVGDVHTAALGAGLPGAALVNAADVIAIRDNPRGAANPAAMDDPRDVNRDMRIDAVDMILARNNAAGPLSALRLITPLF